MTINEPPPASSVVPLAPLKHTQVSHNRCYTPNKNTVLRHMAVACADRTTGLPIVKLLKLLPGVTGGTSFTETAPAIEALAGDQTASLHCWMTQAIVPRWQAAPTCSHHCPCCRCSTLDERLARANDHSTGIVAE